MIAGPVASRLGRITDSAARTNVVLSGRVKKLRNKVPFDHPTGLISVPDRGAVDLMGTDRYHSAPVCPVTENWGRRL